MYLSIKCRLRQILAVTCFGSNSLLSAKMIKLCLLNEHTHTHTTFCSNFLASRCPATEPTPLGKGIHYVTYYIWSWLLIGSFCAHWFQVCSSVDFFILIQSSDRNFETGKRDRSKYPMLFDTEKGNEETSDSQKIMTHCHWPSWYGHSFLRNQWMFLFFWKPSKLWNISSSGRHSTI